MFIVVWFILLWHREMISSQKENTCLCTMELLYNWSVFELELGINASLTTKNTNKEQGVHDKCFKSRNNYISDVGTAGEIPTRRYNNTWTGGIQVMNFGTIKLLYWNCFMRQGVLYTYAQSWHNEMIKTQIQLYHTHIHYNVKV